MATTKCHLNQERANIQPTKNADTNEDNNKDSFPKKKEKSFHCFTTIIVKPEKGKTYSDQTRRFPYQSLRGNKYIFILYDYDSNAILQEELKDRPASSLTQ